MAHIPLHHAQQLCDEHEEDTHAQAGSGNSESEEAQRQWEEDQDRIADEQHQREIEIWDEIDRANDDFIYGIDRYDDPFYN